MSFNCGIVGLPNIGKSTLLMHLQSQVQPKLQTILSVQSSQMLAKCQYEISV
ncbi:GTPase [Wolbachia endosymbiont (group B) of Dolichovespula media]|uniref:GTPase n=1 Tax=Wolbachia endosymbiont (group B) of Dolichovespula media TaxID=2954001 RepID=UPI00386B3E8F